MEEKRDRKRSGRRAVIWLLLLMLCAVAAGAVTLLMLHETDESGELSDLLSPGKKIGVIPIEGTITSSDAVLKQLKKFGKRSSVKAIVLRINSPGGAVAPAQEIYREIEKTKQKKPVVASIETVGASAAYYIASPANRVVCSRGTITGSIGVIMVLAEVQKIMEKMGIKVEVVKAGQFKDIGSAVRPLTEKERQILESFAQEIHEQFIKDVEAGRKGKIKPDKLREIADGRFFTGERAKEWGLVDTIGNFYDAVTVAAELGGIKVEPELVYPKKRWDGFLDLFVESVGKAVVKMADESRLIQVTPAIR